MIPSDSIDCHAHIIDVERFPVPGGPGYKPTLAERGTSEEYCTTLDEHGFAGGVLVQLSGYGVDNVSLLDAVRRHPARFKAIAVVDASFSDRTLEDLARGGVVGVRFNLPSYDPSALMRKDGPRLLERIRGLSWFAQVYADDDQWVSAAPVLRASGVRVLVDHFGVHDITRGVGQLGFGAVLELGSEGRAVIKLSSLFRVSRMERDFTDLDPFVERIVAAFGIENCLWGSDWPFVNWPRRPRYVDLLTPLARWFPDPRERRRVLVENPTRLFGRGKRP